MPIRKIIGFFFASFITNELTVDFYLRFVNLLNNNVVKKKTNLKYVSKYLLLLLKYNSSVFYGYD